MVESCEDRKKGIGSEQKKKKETPPGVNLYKRRREKYP